MRLRPAAPGSFRKTIRPMKLGGYEIPEGSVVLASSFLAHRQADVYPDPERFDVKRFLGKKPDPYAWLPFGGGSRRCLGMAYAMYEMKVVCATLLINISGRTGAIAAGHRHLPCRLSLAGKRAARRRTLELTSAHARTMSCKKRRAPNSRTT